jgi:hypothetical protein
VVRVLVLVAFPSGLRLESPWVETIHWGQPASKATVLPIPCGWGALYGSEIYSTVVGMWPCLGGVSCHNIYIYILQILPYQCNLFLSTYIAVIPCYFTVTIINLFQVIFHHVSSVFIKVSCSNNLYWNGPASAICICSSDDVYLSLSGSMNTKFMWIAEFMTSALSFSNFYLEFICDTLPAEWALWHMRWWWIWRIDSYLQ